jgi:uncharacterized protein YlaN (UPF0358 family)
VRDYRRIELEEDSYFVIDDLEIRAELEQPKPIEEVLEEIYVMLYDGIYKIKRDIRTELSRLESQPGCSANNEKLMFIADRLLNLAGQTRNLDSRRYDELSWHHSNSSRNAPTHPVRSAEEIVRVIGAQLDQLDLDRPRNYPLTIDRLMLVADRLLDLAGEAGSVDSCRYSQLLWDHRHDAGDYGYFLSPHMIIKQPG